MLIINIGLLLFAVLMKAIGFVLLASGDFLGSKIAALFGMVLAIAGIAVAGRWGHLPMVLVSILVTGLIGGLWRAESRYIAQPKFMDPL